MEPVYWVAILTVVVCWSVLVVAVLRWGPGVHHRNIYCQEKGKKARILVVDRETEFGATEPVDIRACSLFPHGSPVNCEKHCLNRL